MILKFINRKKELNALYAGYKSKKAEFFVIYGRRRIGKTELIKHFSKTKPHFYFLAKEEDIRLEIERFRERFSEKFNIRIERTTDIEKIFKEILEKIDLTEKLLIIIDEFPFWIAKHKAIVSEFQYLWDEILSKHNVFLILTGSSVSVIESEILSQKSPLFGRRTGQINVESIPFENLKNFLPDYSIRDIIYAYGIVGAIPFYLKEFNSKKDITLNISNTFLNKSNILYEEAESMLRQELREVNTYFNILMQISEGATKLSEISSKAHVDITNINKYLSTLMRLNLVKKEFCITQALKTKNFVYRLNDNYFKFWLKYVYNYKDEIEENKEAVLSIIKKEIDKYTGPVFEEVCMKFIRKSNFLEYAKLGRWWHKDKEIDIVALNDATKEILFAECKWQDKVDADKVLDELKEKSRYVEWNNAKRKESFAIFAKSFRRKIKQKDVYIFDLHDLEKLIH